MLYSGCLRTALAENKGDAVSASLRERKWATQNHGFSLARRPPKDQGSSCFPSPMRVEFEPVPQQLLGKKKKKSATSFPRPAAPRFDSVLCLWVAPVPLVLVSSPLGCRWGAAHAPVPLGR